VREISSPRRVASVSNLCNGGASWQGTWVTGSVAPVLASEAARYFREVQHDRGPTGSLELHGKKGIGNIPRSHAPRSGPEIKDRIERLDAKQCSKVLS